MKKEKPKFEKKCDVCSEIADINVQKIWIKWKYNSKTGEYFDLELLYDDIDSAYGEENLYFCEECFDKWRLGKVK